MSSREIERFRARSVDGQHECTIVVRQEYIACGTHAEPSKIAPGLKWAETTAGKKCNRIDDDRWIVVGGALLKDIEVRRVGLRPYGVCEN